MIEETGERRLRRMVDGGRGSCGTIGRMRRSGWVVFLVSCSLDTNGVASLSATSDDEDASTGEVLTTYELTDTSAVVTTGESSSTDSGAASDDSSTGVATSAVDSMTGDTTGVDGSTGGESGSTGEPGRSCADYCAAFQAACVDFPEYDNTQQCLMQCSQWPVGELEAVEGDSLGCRMYHAAIAGQIDPGVHCPHAGPSGGGVCAEPNAPTCEGYCAVYFMNCTDDLNLYDDMGDCSDQCSHWYPGKNGDVIGDSIGCRDYHAGVALGDPITHCPHAGPGGGGQCVVQ